MFYFVSEKSAVALTHSVHPEKRACGQIKKLLVVFHIEKMGSFKKIYKKQCEDLLKNSFLSKVRFINSRNLQLLGKI